VDPLVRIEQALEGAVASCESGDCAPQLAAAIRHAVFPGGARVRPRLAAAIAACCGGSDEALICGAAAAVELMHCASLVHDDLPCFDDAELRRGRPSVHRLYGERIAVLAGDAIIVLAFETLARAAVQRADRLPALIAALGSATGAPRGIASGQAWECEPVTPLVQYQQQKTGALFVAAVTCGALAAGADPAPWQAFAARLGEAYQVADDIRDVVATCEETGKPAGQDVTHGRPSAVAAHGIQGACRHFDALMEAALESVPPCPGAVQLRILLRREAERLLPPKWARQAA
jgi:geranylgeranyl diphosphate synthase type II